MLITSDEVENKRYGNRARSCDTVNATYDQFIKVTLAEPYVLNDSARYVATATIFHPTPQNATKSIDLIVALSDGVFAVGYELINPRDEPEFLYAVEDLSGEFFDPHLYSFLTEEYIEYSPLHTVQVNLGGAIEAFGIGKTVSDVNRMGAYEYSKTLKPSQ